MKHLYQDGDATRQDAVTRQQRRRDRARIEPQRTGPDRSNVASLDDTLTGLGFSRAEQPAGLTIDSKSFAHLGLSLIEKRAILAHFRDGIVPNNLHVELGCSRAEAVAALNRGLRKLARSPESIAFAPLTNSLRLTYKERFASGVRPWALSKLDSAFLQIMHGEKNYYIQGQRVAENSIRVLPVVVENANMATITLQRLKTAVNDAETNRERVAAHLEQVRLARDAADGKVQAAEYDLRKENALAIFENRAPETSLQKRLATVRTELAAHENALTSARGALELSEAAVSAAKNDMEIQRRGVAEAAIAKLVEEYLNGQIGQAGRLSRILDVLGEHGMGTDLILAEPPDQYEKNQLVLTTLERSAWIARVTILNAEFQLLRARNSWPELKRLLA